MFPFNTMFLSDADDGAGSGAGTGEGEAAKPDPNAAAAKPAAGDGEKTVPYDRFTEVNEALKETKAALETVKEDQAKVQAAQTKAQRDGLSELDRVKAELADATAGRQAAEQERDGATSQVTDLTRGGWVRAAAAALKFHDPEDAIARINLQELRTEDAAKREVKALSESAKHLVSDEKPAATGGDLLQQVLERGKPSGEGKADDKKVIPAGEFNALKVDQLVALQETDPDLYRRSLSAASEAA